MYVTHCIQLSNKEKAQAQFTVANMYVQMKVLSVP